MSQTPLTFSSSRRLPRAFPKRIALLSLLAATLAGCFEVRSEIYLDKDGSGNALVSYAISDAVLKGGPFGDFIVMDQNGVVGLDRAKIASKVERRPGLKLDNLDVWTNGEAHFARLDIQFDHVEQLGENDISYAWNVEDGGWMFRIIVDKKPGKHVDSPIQKGLSKSFGEKGFFFKVHLPGKIVDSNAAAVNWNVAEFNVPIGFFLQSEAATKVYYAKIEAGTWDRIKAWLLDLLPS